MRPPRRFDFAPLELAELREILDRRFAPHDFPEELVEALWGALVSWPESPF